MPRLYERSPNWHPDDTDVPREIAKRAHAFTKSISCLFKPTKCKTNLLPIQSAALCRLRNHPLICVMKTDKNLGPAIIERHRYIVKAYENHLSDKKTYRQLDERTATNRITAVKHILTRYIERHFKPRHPDRIFLERNLEKFSDGSTTDPYSRFYLTAKIHKTPWKTRPIISVSGSLLHALGRYLDAELQIVIKRLPFVVRSSADYVQVLKKIGKLPEGSKLFTMDASAMYTNINTAHALEVIQEFFDTSPLMKNLPVNKEAILDGLRILMHHNVFRLEDTFYVQMDGTAMGSPPACMYATLYFAIHEIKIIKLFPQLRRLYGRYIDDGNGIWIPVPNRNNATDWARFKTTVGNFGTLTWEFSELTNTLPFLDIQITIDNGIITTRLYEKALNLYLYLPPSSTHSPSATKGLVYGMVKRIHALTTDPSTARQDIANLKTRLIARGHDATTVRKLIAEALSPTPARIKPNGTHVKLHLPYHPLDPHSSRLQEHFRRHLSEPPGRQPLADIRNQDGEETRINRMIVCYSRHRNLAELLAPRKFKGMVKSVAETIRDLQTEADVLPPRVSTPLPAADARPPHDNTSLPVNRSPRGSTPLPKNSQDTPTTD